MSDGVGRDIAKSVFGVVSSGLVSLFLSVVALRDWAVENLRDHPVEFVSGFLIASTFGGAVTYFVYGGWKRHKDRERPSQEQLDELTEKVHHLESSGYQMAETIKNLPSSQKAALWYAYDVKGDPFSSRDCGLSEELEVLAGYGILDRVKASNFDVSHYVISPGANGVVSGDPRLLEELEMAREDTIVRRERRRRDSLFRNFRRLTPEEKLVIIDLYHLKGHAGRIPNRTKRDLDNGCVGLRSFISADEIDPGSVNVHLEEGVAEMLEEHRDYVKEIEDAREIRRREEEAAEIMVDPCRLLYSLDLRGMTALRRLVGGDLRLDHYEEGELDTLYEYDLVVEHDLTDGGCELELNSVVASYFSSRAGGDELDMAIADLERVESEGAG